MTRSDSASRSFPLPIQGGSLNHSMFLKSSLSCQGAASVYGLCCNMQQQYRQKKQDEVFRSVLKKKEYVEMFRIPMQKKRIVVGVQASAVKERIGRGVYSSAAVVYVAVITHVYVTNMGVVM